LGCPPAKEEGKVNDRAFIEEEGRRHTSQAAFPRKRRQRMNRAFL